jgi:multifunctional cyclase/dehydratase/O-methyltransferase
VDLGVPDLLDEPATLEQLAEQTRSEADPLGRVLDYAVARGFIARNRKGRYEANAVTTILRKDHPNSWRGWVEFAGSDWFWNSWIHAKEAVSKGGTSGTRAATGHDFFEYITKVDPSAGAPFNLAMEAGATLQAVALVHGLKWKALSSVCDVGGGTGAALEFILQAYPHLGGTLFDLPEVVAEALPGLSSEPLAGRCKVIGGDFFDSIPEDSDRYLMLAVIHDWDDEEAAQILRNARNALKIPGSHIVVVENVMSSIPRDEFVTASDLLMLVLGSGRERTQAQFERLFDAGGLKVTHQTTLGSGFTAFELGAK